MKRLTLPILPYEHGALAPIISRSTIDFHYGKHLQTYIDNLNKLIEGTPLEQAGLETIVKSADGAVFNNAAQTWNHTFYFNTFSPLARQKPGGKLLQALEKHGDRSKNSKKNS